jgi:hypothetical protein
VFCTQQAKMQSLNRCCETQLDVMQEDAHGTRCTLTTLASKAQVETCTQSLPGHSALDRAVKQPARQLAGREREAEHWVYHVPV